MTSLLIEITNILQNEDTPWEDRLKFADNAFTSSILPLRQKEIFLLIWIFREPKNLDLNTLQQSLNWITSPQVLDINRSDLSSEDLAEVTMALCKCLSFNSSKSSEKEYLLYSISIAFLENKIFQHHFKFNMDVYYKFVSTFIANIKTEDLLESALSNDQLFNKSLPNDYKSIVEGCLWPFVKVAAKYPNSERIFNATSNIIKKCIFKPNFDKFSQILNRFFTDTKKMDVDLFLSLYSTNIDRTNIEREIFYKLLLDAFYKCTKNFLVIYQFIVVLLKNLGLRFGELYKCKPVLSINLSFAEGLPILVQVFDVIGKNKNDFDCKIGDKKFSDFIKDFAQVRFKQDPSKEALKLANVIFKMDASFIHDLTDHLIIHLLLNNFEDIQSEYNDMVIYLLETYSKLHRIPGLIHKLIAAPIEGPSGVAVSIVQDDSFLFLDEIDYKSTKSSNYNIESTFSTPIIEALSKSLVQLVSNQSINVFMTLLHKFDVAIKDLDASIEDPKKIFMLEIISAILCQLLSSVRFADNTIADNIMSKFVNIMERIKDGLQVFGMSLVALKHDAHMMRAFLNSSYTWAELYIILEYYCINKTISCKRELNFSDNSTCNISYLHNYLTSEQWCLISERITNFGETPCKQLLHKLFMQKLRAMYLFESEINPEILNSVQQTTVCSMRTVWSLLLTDPFSLDFLVPKLDYEDKRLLANFLISDIVKNEGKSLFYNWKSFNNMDLNKAIYTSILQEMGKLLRSKRKRDSETAFKNNSTKILKELLDDIDTMGEEHVIEIFTDYIGKLKPVQPTYNESHMKLYLSLLQKAPFGHFDENLQVAVFVYLCTLLCDIRNVTVDPDILATLESLILSILQLTALPIIGKMSISALISFIEGYFVRYKDVYEQIINIFLKNEEFTMELSNGITLLTKSAKVNDKYIDLCLITIKYLFKYKASKKITPEHKSLLEGFTNDIYSKLMTLIIDKKVFSVEVYAYALNNYINTKNTEQMDTILPMLDTYYKHSITTVTDASEIGGILTLLRIIVKNKLVLNLGDADATLTIWNVCKNIAISEKDEENYSKLTILIFENIPNEQFQNLLDDIMQSINKAISSEDESSISRELKRCTHILPCIFNGTKLAMWLKSLEQYLLKLTQYFCAKNGNNALVKFVLNLQSYTKMTITSVMIDISLITVQNLISNVQTPDDLHIAFPAGFSILESLIKHRKLLILERFPAYLQQYRNLLAILCHYSDISKPGSDVYMTKCAEYAHSLEKLTTYIVSTGKHMSRISQYLITEFLKHYETITIDPTVKLHLNNCIFGLMSLCDSHAIAYLMRVLSTASTEMFKILYETYQKYYKFTGKV